MSFYIPLLHQISLDLLGPLRTSPDHLCIAQYLLGRPRYFQCLLGHPPIFPYITLHRYDRFYTHTSPVDFP